MGPFRRLAQMLARMFRSVARAIEGADRRRSDDSLDIATAVLAERFPGAPDHWLRYIAARAPHLGAANIEDTHADGTIDGGYPATPPKVRWWWPRSAGRRDAPLQLQQPMEADTHRHEPVAVPAAHKGNVAPERAGIRTPTAPRPKLRVAGDRPGDLSYRSPKQTPLYADGQTQQKAKATLTTQARERLRRPHLRITITRSLEQSRAELKLDAPPKAASRGTPFSDHRHREPVTVTPFAPPLREQAEPAFDGHEQPASDRAAQAALTWMSATRAPRPEEELRTSPNRAADRRTATFVPWAAQGGRHANATELWSPDMSRSHWPELLPPERFDVDNAPTQLPNIERLRSEQDFGSWSG